MRSEMRESRTPRTAIFDPLRVCLQVTQVAQKGDPLFVFVHLSSSEITDVAARIAATVSLWKSITCVFGKETGVSHLGIRKGSWSRL
jgi:hypothetical protein